MLKLEHYSPDEVDQLVFDALVPQDHYLRKVKQLICFDRCRDLLADCYCPDFGRPALDPGRMLKFAFLAFQYNLSDRAIIRDAQVNVAFRFFLDLGLHSPLPDFSSLSIFRSRLGAEKFQQVFDDILAQAREHGLLKDRLRLKDATHVLANIAIPSTIALVAQTREKLLQAALPFARQQVEAALLRVEEIRVATADLSDEERLLQRVTHLREIVTWIDALTRPWQADTTPPTPTQQCLLEALELAHQVLADRDDPKKGDEVVSPVDPDARWGKHGDYFAGYLLDITEDADSELITGVHVLPGNGDEGADATALIQEEEAAHGNDVEGLSIDGAGFRGDLLQEWQDPEGLNLEVTVPPSSEPAPTGRFSLEMFTLDESGQTLSCPEGKTTRSRERNNNDTGFKYRFKASDCRDCPQRAACLGENATTKARTVIKNDYEAEYKAARERAKTAEHARTRKEHPRVERKLAEIVRRHGGRQARYHGRKRVLTQYLMTAVVVNIKRMVKLLQGLRGTVRAEAALVSG